jgi:hypothetical protein
VKVNVVFAVMSTAVVCLSFAPDALAQAQNPSITLGAGLSQGVSFDPMAYNGGALFLDARLTPGNTGYSPQVNHSLFSKYPTNTNNGGYIKLGEKTPGLTEGVYRTTWTPSIAYGTADVYFKVEAVPYKLVWVGPPLFYQTSTYPVSCELGAFYGYSQPNYPITIQHP